MKKAILILAILICSILYYMGVMTGKESLPFSKDFFAVETSPVGGLPMDVKTMWPLKVRPSGQKLPTLTPKELDSLYQAKLDRGARNVPSISFLLIREAERARREGDVDASVRLATYSTKFSPDLSQPYYEVAKARWRQNPFQFGTIAAALAAGIRAQWSYFPSSLSSYYDLFYLLSNAILLTFMVFALLVLVKYFPLYFDDIRRSLTQEISKVVLNSIKIFLLFIPFFLRLDLLWAILFWGIVLWGYVPKKERHLLFVFFILLVYLPLFLRLSSAFLDSPTSEILLDINRVNYEEWDEGTEKRLQAWLAARPEDADVLFTAGLIEKKKGRYDRAEKLYKGAIQGDPGLSEAHSNLGNVYMARREIESAVSSYEKAASIEPERAAYYYNLYRAYSQQTFLSGKLDKALQKARQLDPKLIDPYLGAELPKQNPNINRLVIDERLTAKRLWKRVWREFAGTEGILYHLFKAWFEKIPSRVGFLLPIFFLGVVVAVSRYSRAKRFMTRCPMCGSGTHRFYLGASVEDFICFNCYRIYVKREKFHTKIVEKKSLQVQQFQTESYFISRLISHFIVGFGYLWQGRFLTGLLLTFLFFVFVMRFVHWGGVISLSWIRSPLSFWNWLAWGGLFVGVYAIWIRQVYRFRPGFKGRSGRV